MQHTPIPCRRLGLSDINPGTWSGSHGWSEQTSGAVIESINPATAKRLAQVRGATLEDYEQVMAAAVAAAAAWRQVPAPKRGEAVRLIGEELRKYKDALGSLVSMENGKIKAEGRRRSPGDDRYRRFRGRPIAHAVRPHHALRTAPAPHVRAMASARRRGRDFSVQFSRGGLVLECFPGGDQPAMPRCGSPRPRPPCAPSPCSTSAIA